MSEKTRKPAKKKRKIGITLLEALEICDKYDITLEELVRLAKISRTLKKEADHLGMPYKEYVDKVLTLMAKTSKKDKKARKMVI